MELNGLTALVTGGAAGIGAGIAERLAAEGMHVVIADLDDRQGPITAERAGSSFLRTDLASPADVRAAVDAAKAGVVRFTACLAPWPDTMALRVNCICPGLVDHAVPGRRAAAAASGHRRAGVSGSGRTRSRGRGRSAAPRRRAAR